MKTFIISILALLLAAASNQSYTGEWVYSHESGSADFSLTLTQKDSTVWGNHCSIMLNGNRIDCAEDNEESIRGTIKNNELIVTIKSMYSMTKGKAKISFVGKDSIYFEFITRPADGCWIPDKVTLTRKK